MVFYHSANPKVLAIIFIIYAFVTGGLKYSAMAEEETSAPEVKCNIHETSCTKNLENLTVTLNIEPKPVKAMTDLTFSVIVSGKKPTATPYIDLGMPGMNMGPNQVKLTSIGNNTYSGKGVIVRCPSGRRTWKAEVTLPDIGTVEFVFDVVY